MTADISLRLVRSSDAAELSALIRQNRDFLQPFDPVRPPEYFSEDGQRIRIAALLRQHSAGTMVPLVVTAGETLVGAINVNSIVRGSFESASLGYWIDQAHGGRGIASRAVGLAVDHAFSEIGLHRIEAGTLVDNVRSQRVLEKNGFQRYGLAPGYLRIAGRWQDHVLFQRLAV